MIYLRCALVWTGATSLAALACRWLLTPSAGAVGGFQGLLLHTCSFALAACVLWAWAATSAVVLDAARRRPRERRAIPARLRRFVLAACGVALAAGASPALATPGPVPLAGPVGHVHHLRQHGRPQATSRAVVVVPELTASSVVVRSGDTLWSIAARGLPVGATDRQVAAAWHRIYQRNRDVIGANPDLLLPGQRLELPR